MKREYPLKDKNDRTKNRFRNAPKSYRKYFWKVDRAKEKMAIEKIKNGEDEVNVDIPRQHRHSALWAWW